MPPSGVGVTPGGVKRDVPLRRAGSEKEKQKQQQQQPVQQQQQQQQPQQLYQSHGMVTRAEGTRKGRFQIRDLTEAFTGGGEQYEDDEHSILLFQDGKFIPSPQSSPRAMPLRAPTEGDMSYGFQYVHESIDAAALNVVRQTTSSGLGATDNLLYANVAGAMAAPVTATVTATATVAIPTSSSEPVRRQIGRFKLRDIGEASLCSASASTSSSSSPASGGMKPIGQSQPATIPATFKSASMEPSIALEGGGGGVSGGGGSGSGTVAISAPATNNAHGSMPDYHSTMLTLVEQNRQLLERLAGSGNSPYEGSLGTSVGMSSSAGPPGHPTVGVATAGGEKQANHAAERTRTSIMGGLTVQASLPPKPPGSTPPDRKDSPVPREGNPPGWWGSQGQQGLSGQPGQPPRRPSTAGGGGSSAQGNTGGSVSGGVVGGSNKAKDDGTGRRAERGRMSTLVDQLKDEIDINAAAKKDMDLELKRVKQRNRLMEERSQEEKQKTSAAEAKVAKLQARNRTLTEENTQLRQILQQIQDAGITLPKAPPPPSPPQQPQPLHQQQQGLPSGPPVSVESGSVNGGPSPSNKSRPGHRPSGVGAKLAAPAAAAKQGHGQGQPQQQQQHKDEKQPQQLQRAQQQPQQQQPQEKQQQQPTSTTQGPLRKPGGSVPQQHSGPVGPGRVQQVSHLGLHGNRMPSSSTGTDDTRSPQRRSPDLAGPDSGSSKANHHMRNASLTGIGGVLGSSGMMGMSGSASAGQGPWQGQSWVQNQGMRQGLGGGTGGGNGGGNGSAQVHQLQQGSQGSVGRGGQSGAPLVPSNHRNGPLVHGRSMGSMVHGGQQHQQQQMSHHRQQSQQQQQSQQPQQQPQQQQPQQQGRRHRRSNSGTLPFETHTLSNGNGGAASGSGATGSVAGTLGVSSSSSSMASGGHSGGVTGSVSSVRISPHLEPRPATRRPSSLSFNSLPGGIHVGAAVGKDGGGDGKSGASAGGTRGQWKLEVMQAAIMNSFGRSPASSPPKGKRTGGGGSGDLADEVGRIGTAHHGQTINGHVQGPVGKTSTHGRRSFDASAGAGSILGQGKMSNGLGGYNA